MKVPAAAPDGVPPAKRAASATTSIANRTRCTATISLLPRLAREEKEPSPARGGKSMASATGVAGRLGALRHLARSAPRRASDVWAPSLA